jgi:hypothetical protein
VGWLDATTAKGRTTHCLFRAWGKGSRKQHGRLGVESFDNRNHDGARHVSRRVARSCSTLMYLSRTVTKMANFVALTLSFGNVRDVVVP